MSNVRTVGIDLAAEPRSTAVCTLVWTDGAVVVESARLGADDHAVLTTCAGADRFSASGTGPGTTPTVGTPATG